MRAFKYTGFAAISTLANLLFQFLIFSLYSGSGSLYVAMFVGVIAGLMTKYFLDKKWIFYYSPKDNKDDVKKFILYSVMGVLTTFIFCVTEMAFYYLFSHPNAKYMGIVIGLMIGYIIKYNLDKKYIFNHRTSKNI